MSIIVQTLTSPKLVCSTSIIHFIRSIPRGNYTVI